MKLAIEVGTFLIAFSQAVLSVQDPCNLFCSKDVGFYSNISKGPPGSPGKRGAQGPPGNIIQCSCEKSEQEVRQVVQKATDLINSIEGNTKS